MNQPNQNPLDQFLPLLIPNPQYGAILPTADTLALFGLSNDYHVKKHRDAGNLQEGVHFIQVRGGLAANGTQVQDNITRIYYTLDGLLTLAKLNVGDRAGLVYQALMNYKPNAAIVAAEPSHLQPWQPTPSQMASQFNGHPPTRHPEQFTDPALTGYDQRSVSSLTHSAYGQSYLPEVTHPLGTSPGNHPVHVITATVEQAIERVIARQGSAGSPDANAHDLAGYLFKQQELTANLVQSISTAVTGAASQVASHQKPQVLAIDRETPQWQIWFIGIALTVVSAGIVFLLAKAAFKAPTSSALPEQTEVAT